MASHAARLLLRAARLPTGHGGPPRSLLRRALATGPASGGAVSDELLAKLGGLSTQALIDGRWVMGWRSSHIEGARGLSQGQKGAGRSVTLNMVPGRPDVAADKPAGEASPEYEAFELCGLVPRPLLPLSLASAP